MGSAHVLLPIVSALLAAAAARSQDVLATIGRFVDLDGKPVADAQITFATSPPRVFDTFAPTTLETVETDAEGRYRVLLRTGRGYSAWAIGPDEVSGRARSAVREGVIAGNVVDFAAATRAPAARKLQFEPQSLAALRVAPLFAVVRFDAQHHRPLRFPIRPDGSVDLPPLPEATLRVHLVDAAGAVVVPSVVAYAGSAAFGEVQTRRFVVRDEHGDPVPDAIVSTSGLEFFGRGAEPFGVLRFEANTVRSQPTDANGRTEMLLPAGQHLFVASAAGFAAGTTGAVQATWIQDGTWTDEAVHGVADEVVFTLGRAPALRGRVHRGDRALADLGVKLATSLRFEQAGAFGSMCMSLDFGATARTEADGAFAFASVPKIASGLQLALQSSDDEAPPVLLLPRESVPAAPLDLDLANWPVVTFRGTTATGGPAGDLRVVLLPGHTRIATPDLVSLPADRAGRVRAQMEPGDWFVFATDGDGVWTDVVTIAPGAKQDLPLPLAPLARLTGTLRDANNKPIAGSGFSFGGTQGSVAPPASPREALLRQHAMLLTRGLTARARTDAEGRFELRYVALPGVTVLGNPDGCYDCRIELREGAADEIELRSEK